MRFPRPRPPAVCNFMLQSGCIRKCTSVKWVHAALSLHAYAQTLENESEACGMCMPNTLHSISHAIQTGFGDVNFSMTGIVSAGSCAPYLPRIHCVNMALGACRLVTRCDSARGLGAGNSSLLQSICSWALKADAPQVCQLQPDG
jgi:hypothetical protein